MAERRNPEKVVREINRKAQWLPFIPSALSIQQLAQPGILIQVLNAGLSARYWEPISPKSRAVGPGAELYGPIV